MSISSAIDANNPDVVYRGKFYPDLIPFGHPPAQQGLGSVLQVNSSAFIPNTTTKQDATDFDTLGCVKIETGTVGQGNNLALVIGEAGDTLQIKGATTKGSILVGNGANTEELAIPVAPAPVPPNGSVLILDDTQPLGVRWGGESGDVNSITPGNNINIAGTSANPIVELQSPLTTGLNMGAVAITDSVASTGTAGQVLSCGAGATTLWATPTPAPIQSITAGNNIDNVGTSADPIIQLQSPLTSGLNMGAVAITDSVASTGTAGQVLSCGAGATTLWTTLPVPTWTAYTPNFGSVLTIGDGNVSAYYSNQGKITSVYVDIGWGSTTAFTPTVNFTGMLLGLPPGHDIDISFNTLVAGHNVLGGSQLALDGSVTFCENTLANGGLYGQVIYFPATPAVAVKLSPYYLSGNYQIAPPNPGVTATTPFTWGANSRITAFFSYPST
jgi:hypothetical protein